MLISHGHADHISDAEVLAKKHQPTIIAIVEIARWLENKGIENTIGMNKGGRVAVNGIKATMVSANHSSSFAETDGTNIYLGEPAGYVLEFPNGFTIYHAGDTNVFGDMEIISALYKPDLALLPIGDHFTMGPREAAYAAQLLNVSVIVPIHHGTFPLLTGTPAALRQLTKDLNVEIIELQPGQTLD